MGLGAPGLIRVTIILKSVPGYLLKGPYRKIGTFPEAPTIGSLPTSNYAVISANLKLA